MTNIPVNSIEWRNETSTLKTSTAANVTVLEYTIDPVKDDLDGHNLTCVAVTGTTVYNETEVVAVRGMCGNEVCMIVFYHSISPVPSRALRVETAVSDTGPPLVAGSSGLTLTCTVTENTRGLTEIPYGVWMTESGPVQSEYITETVNTTTAISTLSLSSLNTSHAGLYYCQGSLQTPAMDGDITVNSSPIGITVRCE